MFDTKKQPLVRNYFGNSQNSPAMTSWNGDLKRWGMPSDIANLIAMDCAVHYSAAMGKSGSEVSAKVTKADKGGNAGFKISGKTVNVMMHNSMSIVRLAQRQEELRQSFDKEGLLKFDADQFRSADWLEYLSPELSAYYKSVAKRATDSILWFDTKEEYDEHKASVKDTEAAEKEAVKA